MGFSICRYSGLLHMIDFLPTFLNLAGVDQTNGIDGINQWEAIKNNLESPRKWMVYNIDDAFVPNVLAGDIVHQKFQVGLQKHVRSNWLL